MSRTGHNKLGGKKEKQSHVPINLRPAQPSYRLKHQHLAKNKKGPMDCKFTKLKKKNRKANQRP